MTLPQIYMGVAGLVTLEMFCWTASAVYTGVYKGW